MYKYIDRSFITNLFKWRKNRRLLISNKLCIYSCINLLAIVWFNIEFFLSLIIILFGLLNNKNHVGQYKNHANSTVQSVTIDNNLYKSIPLQITYLMVLFINLLFLSYIYFISVTIFLFKYRRLVFYTIIICLFIARLILCILLFFIGKLSNILFYMLISSNIISFKLKFILAFYIRYNRYMFLNEYAEGYLFKKKRPTFESDQCSNFKKSSDCPSLPLENDKRYFKLLFINTNYYLNDKNLVELSVKHSQIDVKKIDELIRWLNFYSYRNKY